MIESWVTDDGNGEPMSPGTVVETLRARISAGRCETWLSSSSGRWPTFVTDTERAAVSLLEGEGDAGEHAVDPGPGTEGVSTGFVLSNGQRDEYPDEDTVPLDEAFRIVADIVGEGSWPTDTTWVVDR
ncbi:hypothetical protein ACFV0T_20370 [Streptomyces sp. NPDC059582]|uniref:hypothetical protein n=1 Tax=Streptomyces sp. NPDC059582 TaxID=3346875 RepID=UPI0036C13DEB